MKALKKLRNVISRSGLRVEIIAFMIALMTFMLVTLGSVWLRLSERNFIHVKYNVAESVLANIQSMIQLEWEGRSVLVLSDTDRSRLLEIMQTFANNLRLTGIFVVSPDRRIITHPRLDLVNQPYTDADIEAAFSKVTMIKRFLSASGANALGEEDEVQISGPLFLGDQTVGVVRFSLPMRDFVTSMKAMREVLFWYLIFTAVLTVLIGSLVLLRLIIRPLQELESATLRIMEGNLDHNVPIRSENEIGRLARALSQLHHTLLERNHRLDQQKGHLKTTADKLRRAEDEIIRQDRLAYLGRVAAGVAHEIGNPLGAVFNYIGVLKSLPESDDQAGEILLRVQHEVERIDRIVRELLDFSRQRPPSVEQVNLPEFVNKCISILRDQRQLDRIKTEVFVGGEISEFEFDPAQLKQVLFNILTNAKDAIGESGSIRVSLEKIFFSETSIYETLLPEIPEPEGVAFTDLKRRGIVFSSRPNFAKEEPLAVFHIRDSGPGLPEESVEHVFEPFFTTKAPGKGTGLGLAICQRIVENFHGVMRFESRRGRGTGESGTVVSVYIPPARPAVEETSREELLASLGDS